MSRSSWRYCLVYPWQKGNRQRWTPKNAHAGYFRQDGIVHCGRTAPRFGDKMAWFLFLVVEASLNVLLPNSIAELDTQTTFDFLETPWGFRPLCTHTQTHTHPHTRAQTRLKVWRKSCFYKQFSFQNIISNFLNNSIRTQREFLCEKWWSNDEEEDKRK